MGVGKSGVWSSIPIQKCLRKSPAPQAALRLDTSHSPLWPVLTRHGQRLGATPFPHTALLGSLDWCTGPSSLHHPTYIRRKESGLWPLHSFPREKGTIECGLVPRRNGFRSCGGPSGPTKAVLSLSTLETQCSYLFLSELGKNNVKEILFLPLSLGWGESSSIGGGDWASKISQIFLETWELSKQGPSVAWNSFVSILIPKGKWVEKRVAEGGRDREILKGKRWSVSLLSLVLAYSILYQQMVTSLCTCTQLPVFQTQSKG